MGRDRSETTEASRGTLARRHRGRGLGASQEASSSGQSKKTTSGVTTRAVNGTRAAGESRSDTAGVISGDVDVATRRQGSVKKGPRSRAGSRKVKAGRRTRRGPA
jgi:hypothetical protein